MDAQDEQDWIDAQFYSGSGSERAVKVGTRVAVAWVGGFLPVQSGSASIAPDNQMLPQEVPMRYDYIVVGAGSAGSTIATRLSEDPDKSVLLLEAGPDYPDFNHLPDDLKLGNNVFFSAYGPHSWAYNARVTAQQTDLVIPRGKATGGSSAINGQVLYRGIPEDYDRWAEWGNDEWGYTSVLPFFRRMENDHDFQDDWHGTDGPIPVRRYRQDEWLPHSVAFKEASLALGFNDDPDQNHPESTGVSPRARNTLDGVRISTALAYLNLARHRLNFTVRANVQACRVVFDGKRAWELRWRAAASGLSWRAIRSW